MMLASLAWVLLMFLGTTYRPTYGFATKRTTRLNVGLILPRLQVLGHWNSRHPSPTFVSRETKPRSAVSSPALASTSQTLVVGVTAVIQRLPVMTSLPSGVGAASALLVTAGMGYWSERKLWPNSGILVTLATSAVASNFLHFVPSTHPLYDACWTTFVPMSLALLLLSLPTSASDTKDGTDETDNGDSSSISRAVLRLAVPFVLASIGSILGCLTSWAVCLRFPRLWLSPTEALEAAACLTASFIGGSVNFFATASILAGNRSNNRSATLLSAMAAADVVIMALYFAAMSIAMQSKRLQRWFYNDLSREVNDGTRVNHDLASTDVDNTLSQLSMWTRFTSQLLVGTLAFAIVQVAQRCECVLNSFVPGTACAFVVAMTLAVPPLIKDRGTIGPNLARCAGSLSGFTFLLLFASIGVSADIQAALSHGPACFGFSLLALTIHSVVTLTGSLLVQRVLATVQWRLAEILVASNAAIGGPATAAAFCSQVPTNAPWKRSLAVAATVWGVVGYAVGTTIGVSFYRVLSSMAVS